GTRGRNDRQLLRPVYVGKLLLVNLARHSVRRVASGRKLLFAQWAPSGQTFAYATPAAVYVVGPSGARRKLASAPKPNWPAGWWIGWSPDGSYLGLGSFSDSPAVLNAATGQKPVPFADPSNGLSVDPRWWR